MHAKRQSMSPCPANQSLLVYFENFEGLDLLAACKFITRNGKWNDKCKYWFSKSLKPLITYFDVDADNYRTAKGSWKVRY